MEIVEDSGDFVRAEMEGRIDSVAVLPLHVEFDHRRLDAAGHLLG
jgi:hypothetical protein